MCLRFFILKNTLKKDLSQSPTSQFLRVNQSAFLKNYWNGKVVALCLNFTENLKATSNRKTLLVPFPFFSTPASQILLEFHQKKGHSLSESLRPSDSIFLLCLQSPSFSPQDREIRLTNFFKRLRGL